MTDAMNLIPPFRIMFDPASPDWNNTVFICPECEGIGTGNLVAVHHAPVCKIGRTAALAIRIEQLKAFRRMIERMSETERGRQLIEANQAQVDAFFAGEQL